MPIYTYRCEKCGKEMELFQKLKARPSRVCPDCLAYMARVVSKTTFILKGEGWAEDGYAKSPKKEDNHVES